jgi:hypothetical protein
MGIPNIYFPELGCALIVRKKPFKGGQLVAVTNDTCIYLTFPRSAPRGAEVAQGPLGGWNYKEGIAVHLVYSDELVRMFKYRREQNGHWIVEPRKLPSGQFCGLILTHTGVPMSMGCTPVRL